MTGTVSRTLSSLIVLRDVAAPHLTALQPVLREPAVALADHRRMNGRPAFRRSLRIRHRIRMPMPVIPFVLRHGSRFCPLPVKACRRPIRPAVVGHAFRNNGAKIRQRQKVGLHPRQSRQSEYLRQIVFLRPGSREIQPPLIRSRCPASGFEPNRNRRSRLPQGFGVLVLRALAIKAGRAEKPKMSDDEDKFAVRCATDRIP